MKRDIDQPWIISYDYAEEILKMYHSCKTMSYGLNYSAANRYKGSELMFFSKRLKIPKLESPLNCA